MAQTATIKSNEGQNPTVYLCAVGTTDLSVVVSAATLAEIPEAEQSAYVQARALLAVGNAADAMALVQALAAGEAGPPDTRNWAALWLGGSVLS